MDALSFLVNGRIHALLQRITAISGQECGADVGFPFRSVTQNTVVYHNNSVQSERSPSTKLMQSSLQSRVNELQARDAEVPPESLDKHAGEHISRWRSRKLLGRNLPRRARRYRQLLFTQDFLQTFCANVLEHCSANDFKKAMRRERWELETPSETRAWVDDARAKEQKQIPCARRPVRSWQCMEDTDAQWSNSRRVIKRCNTYAERDVEPIATHGAEIKENVLPSKSAKCQSQGFMQEDSREEITRVGVLLRSIVVGVSLAWAGFARAWLHLEASASRESCVCHICGLVTRTMRLRKLFWLSDVHSSGARWRLGWTTTCQFVAIALTMCLVREANAGEPLALIACFARLLRWHCRSSWCCRVLSALAVTPIASELRPRWWIVVLLAFFVPFFPPQTRSEQSMTLPGVCVNYPFSQLLLTGYATLLVRGRDLGDAGHVRARENAWLIETPGPRVKPDKSAVIGEANVGERKSSARIIGVISFSESRLYTNKSAFAKDRASHRIQERGPEDWQLLQGRRYAWKVATVRSIHIHIPVRAKSGVELAPRAFNVVLERLGGLGATPVSGPSCLPGDNRPAVASVARICADMRCHLIAHNWELPSSRGGEAARSLRERWDTIVRRRCAEGAIASDARLGESSAALVDDLLAELRRREVASPMTSGATASSSNSIARSAHVAPESQRKRFRGVTGEPSMTCSRGREDSTEASLVAPQRQSDVAQNPSHRNDAADAPMAPASQDFDYFEPQQGAWCGMHALNNFQGGPYVTRTDCRRAAVLAVRELSEMGIGDAEDIGEHLDKETGYLSIDVINILGCSLLGIHVAGEAVSWRELQESPGLGALVNCNNMHWTALRKDVGTSAWTHINSIQGPRSCNGVARYECGDQMSGFSLNKDDRF